MNILLVAFVILTITEVALSTVPIIWNIVPARRVAACITAVSLAAVSTGIFALEPTVLWLIISTISIYRVINLLRVIENRANSHHLQRITQRTTIVLIGTQLVLMFLQLWLADHSISIAVWLYILAILQLAAAIILCISTIRRLKKTELYITSESLASSELPTVTIAIPARNETQALEEALHALIASDYPKLEILVLDDCSQTKRTPEIIRSFAHAGVRFIKGVEPKENWLAKNQAYDKLADEASGEIIIFCGVDTRFASGTVKRLVLELLGRQKRMMSVLPQRLQDGKPRYSFVQAARYLWELTPPRRLFRRPPVLSSCWIIYRKDLKRLGGFDAVSRMVVPEAYFAKQLLETDGYSFVRANRELGLVSAKTYEAQRLTAIRTRYPQLHRRPENVMLLTFLELMLLAGPFVLLVLGFLGVTSITVTALAFFSFALLSISHVLVVMNTGVQSWYVAIWSFLPVILTDIGLMHVSMQQYEFSEVVWKGRNVCVPVMHVIPSLPKLPS